MKTLENTEEDYDDPGPADEGGIQMEYSRVSFYNGLFYHFYDLVESDRALPTCGAHNCPHSRILSLISVLLALFRCACASYSILVQF